MPSFCSSCRAQATLSCVLCLRCTPLRVYSPARCGAALYSSLLVDYETTPSVHDLMPCGCLDRTFWL